MKNNLYNRLREGITTLIGLFFLLCSLGMVYMNIFYDKEFNIFTSIIPVSLLGWVFLWAKNSILEGVTLGLFKKKL